LNGKDWSKEGQGEKTFGMNKKFQTTSPTGSHRGDLEGETDSAKGWGGGRPNSNWQRLPVNSQRERGEEKKTGGKESEGELAKV